MAVLKKEELKKKVIDYLSEVEGSDEREIELIEDISDTFETLGDDSYEQKYKDLKQKYIERFKKEDKEKENIEETEETEETEKEVTEKDIFEEVK
ncbi:hypothetical protein J6Q66_09030 [bacterium]|nr:hypothetical protein [bacterium]